MTGDWLAVGENWEGIMIEYTECDFPGAEPYKRAVPGWKCKRCGWRLGTAGLPPATCPGCSAPPEVSRG